MSLRGSAFRSIAAAQTIEKQHQLVRIGLGYECKQIQTDLKLPHQKEGEGPVHAALQDENAVREFGGLRDLQIFLC